jgi:hypothetical protein
MALTKARLDTVHPLEKNMGQPPFHNPAVGDHPPHWENPPQLEL